MAEATAHVRPDLAERYRQLRPFDLAEVALVRGLIARPDRLPPRLEQVLRWALNLARAWVVETPDGAIPVGAKLGRFRHRVRELVDVCLASPNPPDPARLGTLARSLVEAVDEARAGVLETFAGRLSPTHLDQEIRSKALVLALGGGGGCGYVHIGAFAALEDHGLRPSLIVGASMGAIIGLFRARQRAFREVRLRAVTRQLSYKRMFRLLDAETRYAMPGAMRLHLRETLARFFRTESGDTMRIKDLEVPFVSVVTGLEREAMRDVQRYEGMFLAQLRKGAFARLVHVKDLIQNVAALLQELLQTPGALSAVPLGHEPETQEFDVIDAVGFSAAVPAILQYDITREDPRMHALMRHTLDRYGVDVFADGGLVANVPARVAWEHVQTGHIGTRNAFVLGLDCFAPQFGRNVLFLPLQRVAAQTVARDAPFAHVVHRYRKVLSATTLVPGPSALERAFQNGRGELETQARFLRKILEPLPERWGLLGD